MSRQAIEEEKYKNRYKQIEGRNIASHRLMKVLNTCVMMQFIRVIRFVLIFYIVFLRNLMWM